MRRAFIASVVIATLVLGGVAFAATITGTQGDDVLKGTAQSDTIKARRGNDLVRGRNGADQLLGGPGADEMFGDRGSDVLNGKFGDDQLTGGNPNEVEYVPDVFNCGTGLDTVFNAVAGVDVVNADCETVIWVPVEA